MIDYRHFLDAAAIESTFAFFNETNLKGKTHEIRQTTPTPY